MSCFRGCEPSFCGCFSSNQRSSATCASWWTWVDSPFTRSRMSCESSPQLALSWPGPTATIVSIAPTKITLYSGPCFTSFGVAQSYPYQNKYCYIGLAVDVRQNSEPDDRQRRYRKIGPGNGTCSRIGGKHDGFKPSRLGPAKRKNCWTFLPARRATKWWRARILRAPCLRR